MRVCRFLQRFQARSTTHDPPALAGHDAKEQRGGDRPQLLGHLRLDAGATIKHDGGSDRPLLVVEDCATVASISPLPSTARSGQQSLLHRAAVCAGGESSHGQPIGQSSASRLPALHAVLGGDVEGIVARGGVGLACRTGRWR